MGSLLSCYSTSRHGKQRHTAEKCRFGKRCKRRRRRSRYSSIISYDPSSSSNSSSCNSNDSSKSTSRMVINMEVESVKERRGLRISSSKMDKNENDEDRRGESIRSPMTAKDKYDDEMDNCSNNAGKRNNDEDSRGNRITSSMNAEDKHDDEMDNCSNNVGKRNKEIIVKASMTDTNKHNDEMDNCSKDVGKKKNDDDNKDNSVEASMTVNLKDDDQIDDSSNKKAGDIASDTRINKNSTADSNKNCTNLDLGRDKNKNKNDEYCSHQEKDIHDHGILNDRTTTQESNSKLLLDCLAEFLVRKHNASGLKGFRTADVCSWLRKVDGALLRDGWQTAGFLNSSSLVLIFLLVRDLPPRTDMRTSEFRSHLLACLYLTYAFSGPEITYPSHHFLVKGGYGFFWERVLTLVNQHSTDMLKLYREPEFHGEVLCELKMYSDSTRRSVNRKLWQ